MNLALGIDIGGTKIRGGLINNDGQVLQILEMPTEADRGGEHVVSRIERLIGELMTEQVCGIGIGVSGQVGLDGTILSATKTFPGWAGIALQKRIADRTKLPVRVLNDVQAMALGELHYGEGKGIREFLCLALGTGVGGAIVSDGKLVRGANGAAGEMGHSLFIAGGRQCPCGKKGCLEAYLSGTALVKRYEEMTHSQKNGQEIIADALKGEASAERLIRQFIEELAQAVSSLVTVFNPSKVILGGGVIDGIRPFLSGFQNSVIRLVSATAAKDLSVVCSSVGDNVMLMGSAGLHFNNN
ncbi:ROK family protein [Paenibacillus filicis]|uniref:ROK family protein n=1 Tax=Paenibacillus gyeongsangnamensis TaxID=3388067 RepID=A0ABT4Q4D7_9BACL|nr:ROK family protein [Paenibacillus filicis]MCZ8511555.1 ROK family protein [Paenibacillus filicis]